MDSYVKQVLGVYTAEGFEEVLGGLSSESYGVDLQRTVFLYRQ